MKKSDGKKLKGQGDINTRYKISTWHKLSVISKTATAGITMIALAITIIVLLILAGVTIATLTGDNGILNQANKAKEETEIADEKERISLALLKASIDEAFNQNQKEIFEKELDKNIGEGKYILEREHLPYLITLKDSDRTYIVKQNDITLKTKDYENIYAILYDDGTLTFSKYKTTIEGKSIAKDFEENIYGKNYTLAENVPWLQEQEYIDKITTVEILDEIMPKSLNHWFNGLKNLREIKNMDNLNTMNVISMRCMFATCTNLTDIDLSNFDTSQIKDMSYAFSGCTSLTKLDVSNFDTSQVTSMIQMFQRCKNLTSLDLSNFDTRNIKNMWGMFRDCSKLNFLDVSSFDTSQVTTLEQTFRGLKSLTSLNLSNFDTSNVTSMMSTFINCEKLEELDISNFDMSKINKYNTMFEGVPQSLKITTNGAAKNWLNEHFPDYTNIINKDS